MLSIINEVLLRIIKKRKMVSVITHLSRILRAEFKVNVCPVLHPGPLKVQLEVSKSATDRRGGIKQRLYSPFA